MEAKRSHDQTPICPIIFPRDINIVQLSLKCIADIEILDKYKLRFLQNNADKANSEFAELLLKHNENIKGNI